MKLSSPQFIFQQFEAERYRFFAVYDESNDLQLSQMEPIEPSAALSKLRNFLRQNTGYHEIYVFKAKINSRDYGARDGKYIAKFALEIAPEVIPGGIQGLAGMTPSVGGYGVLSPDDPRAGAPNIYQMMAHQASVEQQLRIQQKDFEHYKEVQELNNQINRMRDEQTKARGMGALADRLGQQFSDPQVLMGLIGAVTQLFNKQTAVPHPAPMNGVMVADEPIAEDVITEISNSAPHEKNETANMEIKPKHQSRDSRDSRVDEMVNANLTERQKRMITAVNDLQRIDPAFPENIAKLAQIARSNPGVYKMAIQYLSGL